MTAAQGASSTAGATKEKATQGSPELVLRLLSGRFLTQVVLTGKELRVFDCLAKKPATVAELAASLEVPEDRLWILLDAQVALGLLIKEEWMYRLTPTTAQYLVSGKPGYLGGLIEHFELNVYPAWDRLSLALTEGRPQVMGKNGPTDIFTKSQENDAQARIYMEAAHGLGLGDGAALAAGFDFTPYHHLLDIGGGSGALSLAVVERYRDLDAVVFDLPQICRVTEQILERSGFSNKVRTFSGDAFCDALPGAPDVILLSHFVHAFGRKRCEGLLQKCYDFLPPGGCLLLFDPVLTPERTGPMPTLLTNLTLLAIAPGSYPVTAQEYREWLLRAGFEATFDQALPSIRHLVGGYKPR